MLRRRFASVVTMFLLALFISVANAQDTFQFIGNYQSHQVKNNKLVVKADQGAVSISYLKNVGFKVRYSFDGSFDERLSYATVDPMPPAVSMDIRNGQKLEASAGGLTLSIQKMPVRLTIHDSSGNVIMKESLGAGHQGSNITHVVHHPQGADYYGLGEKASSLTRTGKVFEQWNTDAPGYHRGQDPLYKSIPFYVGLHEGTAWGIFYDNSYRSYFDFAARERNSVTFSANGGELVFYVFAGPGIPDVLREYTTLTGRTPLPPKWGIGYQQSRYSYYPDDELRRLAFEFRSRQIPCDVFYLDIDYMNGYRVFTWDKDRFPQPRKLMGDLQDKGFKTVTIVDPGVKIDDDYFMFNEGLKKDLFVKMPNGQNYKGKVWPGDVMFPDFSKPETRDWWGEKYDIMLKDGIDGIWTDMNEPANFGGKTIPDYTVFDKDGHKASALEMHNLYGMLMARTTYNGLKELRPNKRPFVITRAAFSGVQRYSSVWTGDNSAQWDDVYLTMPMNLGLGLSGVPFSGFDIGGFMKSPTGEMYSRFLEIGVFMPFSRTHTSSFTDRQEPWSYGPRHARVNKALIELRYRLLPHLYTTFWEHTQSGSPVIRPLLWEHQDDPNVRHIDDQFYFGDHVMIAPVIHEGQNSRQLYLPEGIWYRLQTDQHYEGRQKITAEAPTLPARGDTLPFDHQTIGVPVFVQGGAVVPTQQVQQYVGQKDLDTVQLQVYSGGSRTSKLYEDDGESQDYHKEDEYRVTTFRTNDSANELSVKISREGQYKDARSQYAFTIHGLTQKPQSIQVNGSSVDFGYNTEKGLATFTTAASVDEVVVSK